MSRAWSPLWWRTVQECFKMEGTQSVRRDVFLAPTIFAERNARKELVFATSGSCTNISVVIEKNMCCMHMVVD